MVINSLKFQNLKLYTGRLFKKKNDRKMSGLIFVALTTIPKKRETINKQKKSQRKEVCPESREVERDLARRLW